MKLLRYVTLALANITTHKLRSFLTMLGIIIGTAAVLITVGLGQGLRHEVEAEIEKLGTNWVTVMPKVKKSTDIGSLTTGDAKALEDNALHPQVLALAPVSLAQVPATNGKVTVEMVVWGTTADYATVRRVKLARGRFFSYREEIEQQRVAVLSKLAAEVLFKKSNPMGKTLRIGRESFLVVGVLADENNEGNSADKSVYVPLRVLQSYLVNAPRNQGEYAISAVHLQIAHKDQIDEAKYQIEQTLRLRHNLGPADENNFYILTQKDVQEQAASITAAITTFLGSIGAISLLVGGIGIMNIMLATVIERTREIGLRKAIGARDQDILLQFLVETLVLCLIGSITGVILSYSVGFLLSQLKDQSGEAQLRVVIESGTVVLGLAVGLISGVLFGLYPAVRATRLDPIEALRRE